MTNKNKTQKQNKSSHYKLIFLVLISIIILVLLVFAGIKIINNFKEKPKDELTLYLEEMGKEFYEEFYYEQLGSTKKEKEEFLSLYQKLGIKISLDTLSKYKGNKFKDKINKFINKETNTVCNRGTTKVIIYPIAPYDRNSYKMVTEIEC